MKEQQNFDGMPDPRQAYIGLAHWLTQVLHTSPQENVLEASESQTEAGQPQLLLGSNYHLQFYQQLPDFITALLEGDPQADVRYAPLLYHLAACSECHRGYLELYDALRVALYPAAARPLTRSSAQALVATPQRMLSHLCQTLISQAEAVQRQSRRGRLDEHGALAQARTLLQQAIVFSARITQSSIRRSALQDLVRVANFSAGPTDPEVRAYTPTFALAGGTRRGKHNKVMRYADALSRHMPESPVIHLQSRSLNGRIIQQNGTLELHLQNLEESLRGHYIVISILLGSLLEPVRWLGGNPRAIRSVSPVDEYGALVTPLGQTELRLVDPEERNLLEAIFMLLEIRSADSPLY